MSKVKVVLFTLIASILTLIATTSVASACWLFIYQPETPHSLIR